MSCLLQVHKVRFKSDFEILKTWKYCRRYNDVREEKLFSNGLLKEIIDLCNQYHKQNLPITCAATSVNVTANSFVPPTDANRSLVMINFNPRERY